MTRKDFKLIADILKDIKVESGKMHYNLSVTFAERLAETNALTFNREKFLKACGL